MNSLPRMVHLQDGLICYLLMFLETWELKTVFRQACGVFWKAVSSSVSVHVVSPIYTCDRNKPRSVSRPCA